MSDLTEDVYVGKRTKKVVDERSWVLESINKHFDVIMEENENETDYEESYYSDSDSYDDDENVGDVQEDKGTLKSSFQMQHLLRSVVNHITSKDRTLDDNAVLNNLKRQLENRQ